MEVKFATARPDSEEIVSLLKEENLKTLIIQPVGDLGMILRMESIGEEQHQEIIGKIEGLFIPTIDLSNQATATAVTVDPLVATLTQGQGETNDVEEIRFESIGPVIGQELKNKAILAIILVLMAIIAYLAYAFRKVSRPVPSWQYGVAAVIALTHDILIVTGIFSVLGHFFNIQVDALFVTALLTILGFSVHDTIVTFDRIRENIFRRQDRTFEEVINYSINETITRSINTTLTVLIVLTAIFLFGGASVKYFILALIFGVIVGTYSSIFIASPLVLIWYSWKFKK